MFRVCENLQPASWDACARAVAGAPNQSSARQTMTMELRRSMKIGGDRRGRKSAQNITQGPNEKDGTGRHDWSADGDRPGDRGLGIVDRFYARSHPDRE